VCVPGVSALTTRLDSLVGSVIERPSRPSIWISKWSKGKTPVTFTLTLIADGFGFHVPKGYIYAAMGFSVGVELLNMVQRNRRTRAAAVQEQ